MRIHHLLRLVIALMISAAAPHAAAAPKISEECNATELGPTCQLYFAGRIDFGDAARIERRILAARGTVDRMLFNSPGGAAFEGIKIGEVLNKYFVAFQAPDCHWREGPQVCLFGLTPKKGQPPTTCASACAFAYLVADFRIGSDVLLHRPYFPASMFAGLAAAEAKKQYQSASADLLKALLARGVGDDIVRDIANTPSNEALLLRRGYPRFSPWLEEWLSARCGDDLSASEREEHNNLLSKDISSVFAGLAPMGDDERLAFDRLTAKSNRYSNCAIQSLISEQKRAQRK